MADYLKLGYHIDYLIYNTVFVENTEAENFN